MRLDRLNRICRSPSGPPRDPGLVTFLVDNQLPNALIRFLKSQGEEAFQVLDLGLAQSSDGEIWRHTTENRMILISKNEDFFHLAGRPETSVLGNCRIPQLLSAFERGWPRAGDRVVEVR